MKEILKQVVDSAPNLIDGKLIAREYLQARLLQILQDKGAFVNWAFQGGTALRFLFSLNRFSEDLDFALVDKKKDDKFKKNLSRVKKMFEAETYTVLINIKDSKVVKSAFIKFPGLLYELGLSTHQNARLSIKIEIDTQPPEGAVITSSVIRRHVILNIAHYDKASLLAGKLHALLARKYTKGRDIYDLAWYLADSTWPEPNFPFLNNALKQTKWQGQKINQNNWRNVLLSHLAQIDWKAVESDVRPFLERQEDIMLVNRNVIEKLLNK